MSVFIEGSFTFNLSLVYEYFMHHCICENKFVHDATFQHFILAGIINLYTSLLAVLSWPDLLHIPHLLHARHDCVLITPQIFEVPTVLNGFKQSAIIFWTHEFPKNIFFHEVYRAFAQVQRFREFIQRYS